ncbi:Mss4-like protein [Exophiala viscosa]|uniref:Mss4-like protein n=1 Tax=Exophiala viscosa TaxID=2486360 RepID=A0AAN6DRI4_9EURO|nr:Mss4-like protein [Exophiala viscosa]
MQGHCNCGSVTVEVNVPPNNEHKGFVCHCRNCQKSSGAGGAYLLMLPLSDITFNGPIKHYLDTNTNSGRAVHRHFCETCGSPLYGLLKEMMPGTALVRTTLFDEFKESPPIPNMELYVKDRWSWDQTLPGAQQCSANP